MNISSAMPARVTISRNARAWFLTLNNPAKLNAIDAEMTYALNEALNQVSTDDSNLPLVLQGAGSAFMAGADLTWFKSLVENERFDELSASLHVAQEIILKVATMSRVVVAAVRGAAIGYGFGLACAADWVIASEKAYFKLGQPSLGLSIDGGLTYTLPRLVGYRRAMELVLADRTLSADKAQQMGLVSRLVDDAQWDSAISLALGELGKVPQSGQNKTLLRESFQVSLAVQLRSEQERFLEAAKGDTFRVRLQEFLGRKA